MAQYEAAALIFTETSRLVMPGETFESDRPPGRNWIPRDDAAHEAVKAHFGENGPPPAPVPPWERYRTPEPDPEPVDAEPSGSGDDAVEIPDGWRDLNPMLMCNLATKLFGKFDAPEGVKKSEYARELIEAEHARRGTVLN